MPLYDYQCSVCGKQREVFMPLKEHGKKIPVCCHRSMGQLLGAAYAIADIEPYKSMITGEMISSRSHHRAHLKQHGCEEVGNEYNKEPKPRQLVGDFDVVPELKRATQEVLAKYRR